MTDLGKEVTESIGQGLRMALLEAENCRLRKIEEAARDVLEDVDRSSGEALSSNLSSGTTTNQPQALVNKRYSDAIQGGGTVSCYGLWNRFVSGHDENGGDDLGVMWEALDRFLARFERHQTGVTPTPAEMQFFAELQDARSALDALRSPQ